MRTQQEIESAIAECQAENERLARVAALPKKERGENFDGEDIVRTSRYNNVTISTLKWLLGSGDYSPAWLLPAQK